MSIPVTLSGNEITDVTRIASLRGDGLLPESSMGVWESATNLMVNGGFETNANNWTLQGSATIARTTTQSKFGIASLQVDTNGVGTGEGAGQTGNKSPVNVSTIYSISMWVLAPIGATLRLTMKEYLAGAFVRDTGFTNFTGNGVWQKVSFTGTTGTGIDGLDPRIATITSNQAITFYVDGVQVEQEVLATPYIETNGSSASRGIPRVRIASDLLSSTQSWVAMRWRPGWTTDVSEVGTPIIIQWQFDANNRIVFYYNDSLNRFEARRRDAGGGGTVNNNFTVTAGANITAICTWDATTIRSSLNGAAFVSTGNTNIPDLSAAVFDIGGVGATVQTIDSEIFWFAGGLGTLTDNDAKIIDSFKESDRNPSEFPGNCAFVWQGRDNYALVPGDQGPLRAPFTPAGHGATW